MKQDGDRISFSNQGRQEFVWPFWDSLETWSPGQVPVPVLGSRIVECSCCRQIQAKMTSVCNLYRREEKAALQKGSSSLSPIEKSDGGGGGCHQKGTSPLVIDSASQRIDSAAALTITCIGFALNSAVSGGCDDHFTRSCALHIIPAHYGWSG